MKFEEFKASMKQEAPPPGITASLTALWYAGKGDWEQAHSITQDINTSEGSWVHAYLHRQEGDEWNANSLFDVLPQLQDQVGIGTVVQPLLFFRETAYTRIVAFPVRHVFDQLKVKVRRPVAVLEAHSEFGDDFAFFYVCSLVEIFYWGEA